MHLISHQDSAKESLQNRFSASWEAPCDYPCALKVSQNKHSSRCGEKKRGKLCHPVVVMQIQSALPDVYFSAPCPLWRHIGPSGNVIQYNRETYLSPAVPSCAHPEEELSTVRKTNLIWQTVHAREIASLFKQILFWITILNTCIKIKSLHFHFAEYTFKMVYAESWRTSINNWLSTIKQYIFESQ